MILIRFEPLSCIFFNASLSGTTILPRCRSASAPDYVITPRRSSKVSSSITGLRRRTDHTLDGTRYIAEGSIDAKTMKTIKWSLPPLWCWEDKRFLCWMPESGYPSSGSHSTFTWNFGSCIPKTANPLNGFGRSLMQLLYFLRSVFISVCYSDNSSQTGFLITNWLEPSALVGYEAMHMDYQLHLSHCRRYGGLKAVSGVD